MYSCENLNFSGQIVTPKEAEYNTDRQIYNRAIQKFPSMIFYCETEEDVRSAVVYCRYHHLTIRIRSGGHNYNGFCIANGVGLIDVSRLSGIQIDEVCGTVTIQSGVSNTQLYEELAKRRYPFPAGTCPSVGVCGYTLGGGWGLSARLFGLGCDSLLEARLVDYKGDVLLANQDCHADLFWALRGSGGGNFGVVTSLTFKLPPKLFDITYIKIDYPNQTAEDQANLLLTWQEEIEGLDRRLNMLTRLFHTQKDGVGAYILGLFYGPKDVLMPIIEPFLTVQAHVTYTIDETTFIDALRNVGEFYGVAAKTKIGSRFISKKYAYEELLALVTNLQQLPEGATSTFISLLGLGGATKDKRPWDTAFYYRDANYIMSIQSSWKEDHYAPVNEAWVTHLFHQIASLSEGSFVNLQFTPLPNYPSAYYGENTCRLRKISAIYDPFDVFTYPQGI